jgi:hypothetical protein
VNSLPGRRAFRKGDCRSFAVYLSADIGAYISAYISAYMSSDLSTDIRA